MTKILCIVGATDKRAITYPLIKTLMHLGRTLIVSDDGVYRRFDETYQTNFDFGNSEFIIVPKVDAELIESINQKEGQFEYVVYITTDEVPPKADKIIYCRGMDKGFASQDTMKLIEESEFTEVLITFDKVQDKKALKIAPTIKQYQYLNRCEDRKEFLPTADPSFATVITKFFEEQLDLPKNTLKAILTK